MQACPYDAIYIDPDTHSAAKCHYCSHRTDLGLEPACVVVCPTRSIIAGDLNNPDSDISRILAREQVNVRKPEQGTAPNLFYVEGDDVGLTPTAAQANFMWSELVSEQNVAAQAAHSQNGNGHFNSSGEKVGTTSLEATATTKMANSGVAIRAPQAQGVGYQGPIHIGEGRLAEHMVQTTYNAQHKVPWHWPVPAYLVTKGIGSGIFVLLAIFFGLKIVDFNPLLALAGNFTALIFIGLTTLLLVLDLEKPATFLRIVLRPQMKSWLARGAFILMGFTVVAGLWLVIEGAAYGGLLNPSLAVATRLPLLTLGFILAIGAAIYTAYLFGQAEGRDLWQSTLLPAHLVIQATMVGSAVLLLLGLIVPMSSTLLITLTWIFGVMLIIDLFVILLGEFGMPHASEVAARAAHDISHGKYRRHFWGGAIGLGHLLPLVLILLAGVGAAVSPLLLAIAALAAVAGLYLFEYVFVMAPQEVPNS
jgi:formate-dependent nitrite reductase membrane component NrfD